MSITIVFLLFFFFKQKTAYELRISDWSSDVCSSDLPVPPRSIRSNIRSERDRVRQGSNRGRRRPKSSLLRSRSARLSFPSTHAGRSEERRVGKACVSTGRSRWSTYH